MIKKGFLRLFLILIFLFSAAVIHAAQATEQTIGTLFFILAAVVTVILTLSALRIIALHH